jgi:hypothetical protein
MSTLERRHLEINLNIPRSNELPVTDVIELDAYHSGSGWNVLGSTQTFA